MNSSSHCHSYRAFVLLLLSLAAVSTPLLPYPASAQQQLKATAILDPRKIALGERTTFTIEISGAMRNATPPQITAPGLQIQHMGYNATQRILNGRSTGVISYIYAVTPIREGRFTIPEVEIRIQNQVLKTEAQELLVLPARTAQPNVPDAGESNLEAAFLRIQTPKSELWVGEVIPLELTLFVRGRNTISGVGQPDIKRENLVIKRFPNSPRQGITEVQGKIYSTLTLETSLFAIAAGTITVGPCTLPCTYFEAQNYDTRVPSFFRRSRRANLTSNSFNLTVKPLPEKGRPADFTGTVGVFSLRHSASPAKLASGDPISVDFEITGVGNFDSLASPMITSEEGWKLYPSREISKQLSDGLTIGRIAFSQVIIPLQRHRQIPPFRFSYFDPEEERYVTRTSDPIPIEVTADFRPEASPASVESPGSPDTPGPVPERRLRPEEAMDDILHIKTTMPALAFQRVPILRSKAFWAAQSVPALALVAIMGIGARRRYREWEARRAAELAPRSYSDILNRLESESLSREEFYRETLAAIETWERDHETTDDAGSDALPDAREWETLRSGAEYLLYGSTRTMRHSNVPAAEKETVMEVLRNLPSS